MAGLVVYEMAVVQRDLEDAFLDLTTNAFALSDRGVKGREAPGPKDVAETPGSRVRVSPSCGRMSRTSSLPLSVAVPASRLRSRTKGAVMTIAWCFPRHSSMRSWSSSSVMS